MKTFLHLAVSSVDSQLREQIEDQLNRAADWLRYCPNCWLIYTGQPAQVWYQRLSEVPKLKVGTFFIVEVNLENRGGWMKPSTWDWIKKVR